MAVEDSSTSQLPTTQKPKQRTHGHVIASISVNYVEAIVLPIYHVFLRVNYDGDYGYDAYVQTFDDQNCVEPGVYWLQFKAKDQPQYNADQTISLKLEVSDLITWKGDPNFVYVILYDATLKRAYWINIQAHLKDEAIDPKTLAQSSVTVRIKVCNVFDVAAAREFQRLKNERIALIAGHL
jgi:hypothetical protein